ncbi:MAG TPA: DUF2878 domain-containing protein [Candidatus Kapabacteria bacterium]|nr:DUF2878 domain-containing protein [Candidatus Kapabacteria bacterium]
MLLNAVLFQAGWLLCVMERGPLALLASALILLVHGRYVTRNRREWLFILALGSVGIALDFLFMKSGVFHIDGHDFPPPWLMLVWLLFASTLNHSLRWLDQRLWLAAVLGAIAAPLSYLAGARLGALQIELHMLPVLGAAWAALLPLAFLCNRRLLLTQPPTQTTGSTTP